MRSLPNWLRLSFGFDVRSLALMRLAVGLVYFVDLVGLWPDLQTFYSDQGLLPRSILGSLDDPTQWSVHMIWSNSVGLVCMHLVHLLAALALAVGWKTRWASLLCWLLATSLQARVEIVPGWEAELRLLFLYGIFLPWGEAFSLDHPGPGQVGMRFTPATLAWRIQLAALYMGAGLLKGGAYWADGTAVECALHSDGYATHWAGRFLEWLQPYPQALTWLNDGIPVVEILVPVMLFFPSALVQFLAAAALMLMHFCFGMMLDIDLFSWASCACLLCFTPNFVWPSRPAGQAPVKLAEAVLLSWAVLVTFLSTAQSLPEGRYLLSARANDPIRYLGLQQRWAMFVPPPVDGGWHVFRGRIRYGQWVDLLHLRAQLEESKPLAIHASYPSVRWYLYCVNHLRSKSARQAAADFFKRRWESHFPERSQEVVEVELIHWHRRYRPGVGYTQPVRRILWRQTY